MSDTVYRWNPDTAIEEVWEAIRVEPLRRDLVRGGVLVPVVPVGTLTVMEMEGEAVLLYGKAQPHDLPPGKYLIVKADNE